MLDERLMKYIYKYIEGHERIYIYGAGNVGMYLCNILLEKGIKIDGFIVTSLMGQISSKDDVPVISIDTYKYVQYNDGIIVGTVLTKSVGIVNELTKRGISDYILLTQEILDYIINQFNSPKLEITTVVGCSVNCKYCPQQKLIYSYYNKNEIQKRYMSFELFKKYLNKVPKNVQIYFVGMAEPFLNKECLKMIEYAIKLKYKVAVYTTCVGLSYDDCRKLVQLPIESVVLHVPDEEHYANISLTEEYWKIIELLLDAKKSDGSNFVDSASCQGVPSRQFQIINNGRIRVESYLMDRAGNIDLDDDKMERCDYISGKIYCSHSNDRLDHNILLPDGTVLLCCMDYSMDYIIGNLANESYNEIINGAKLETIRKRLIIEDDNFICRHCTFSVACQ